MLTSPDCSKSSKVSIWTGSLASSGFCRTREPVTRISSMVSPSEASVAAVGGCWAGAPADNRIVNGTKLARRQRWLAFVLIIIDISPWNSTLITLIHDYFSTLPGKLGLYKMRLSLTELSVLR